MLHALQSDIPTEQLPNTHEADESVAPTRDRGRLYTAVATLLLMLGFAAASYSWVSFGVQEGIPAGLFTQTDFPAVVIASRLAASGDGARLYDLTAQLQQQQTLAREGYLHLSPDDRQLYYPYPYTPFLALLWSPFTGISPFASMAIWDIANIACLVLGLWVLLTQLPLTQTTRALLMLGVLTSLPWIVNLEQGQSSGPVALGLALGTAFLRRKHDIPAGLALGLLFLKVQWFPLIVLVLLINRRWRTLGTMTAVGIILTGFASIGLGPGWLPAYFEVVTSASKSGVAFLLTPAASHSLNGGLYALLGPGGVSLVAPLNLVGTILAAALLVWVWLLGPGKGWDPGTRSWDARMGLTLLAAIFTNLQLNTHDLSLLILPIALGFASAYGTQYFMPERGNTAAILWHSSLWLLYFTPLLMLGALLDASHPFPIRLTTWLMAVMIVVLGSVCVWRKT